LDLQIVSPLSLSALAGEETSAHPNRLWALQGKLRGRSAPPNAPRSAGAPTATEGAEVLRKPILQAGRRIKILPGGGLHASNITSFASYTGACELHSGLVSAIPYNSLDTQLFESAIRHMKQKLSGITTKQ
jgi:hypothetical protein